MAAPYPIHDLVVAKQSYSSYSGDHLRAPPFPKLQDRTADFRIIHSAPLLECGC